MSDEERTRERHLKTMSLLGDTLKNRSEFEIPKLGGLKTVNPTKFKQQLEARSVNHTARSETMMDLRSVYM
jgi:hypothetical protein